MFIATELVLRCMGAPPCFSADFTKGINFCDFLLPWRVVALPKGPTLSNIKGNISPLGGNSYP